MNLLQYKNKHVWLTDVDGRTFTGICLFEDKDIFYEEFDALSIETGVRWIRFFESEIQSIEII